MGNMFMYIQVHCSSFSLNCTYTMLPLTRLATMYLHKNMPQMFLLTVCSRKGCTLYSTLCMCVRVCIVCVHTCKNIQIVTDSLGREGCEVFSWHLLIFVLTLPKQRSYLWILLLLFDFALPQFLSVLTYNWNYLLDDLIPFWNWLQCHCYGLIRPARHIRPRSYR